jgi:hypothetical protein
MQVQVRTRQRGEHCAIILAHSDRRLSPILRIPDAEEELVEFWIGEG